MLKYMTKVRVKSGFYEGQEGVIKSYWPKEQDYIIYLIDENRITAKEDDLEVIA